MMPRTSPRLDGAAAAQPSPAAAKRFELPLLDFKFSSLTEGTDIPAPLPSPLQEVPTPPKTPTGGEVQKKEPEESNGAADGHIHDPETSPKSDITNTTVGGLKRPLEDGPNSPTLSSRGSLRRLLSRTLLNNTYDEQASIGGQGVSRTPSHAASTMTEDRKSKRSSGWFRRLRSSDPVSKRASVAAIPQHQEIKKGPPPPMIPEMSAWESKVDTNIGDDLFKEIK
ncbi:hypothetical protein BJ170DRAFT_306065 [Xylariales sp. AK1849]|nr:hypothetical protein BJ170DRAFT_306065 [Xylariales sp. AK1849]